MPVAYRVCVFALSAVETPTFGKNACDFGIFFYERSHKQGGGI